MLVEGQGQIFQTLAGPFVAGQVVTFKAYVYVQSGSIGRVDVAGDSWFDAQGATVTQTGSWVAATGRFALPANSNSLTLRLIADWPGSEAWFDDVSVYVE